MTSSKDSYHVTPRKSVLDKICSRRRWIFLTSFLFLLVLGCGTYVFYLRVLYPKSKEAILHNYGSIFYTEEEIEKFRIIGQFDRVKSKVERSQQKCSFTCEKVNDTTYLSSPAFGEEAATRDFSGDGGGAAGDDDDGNGIESCIGPGCWNQRFTKGSSSTSSIADGVKSKTDENVNNGKENINGNRLKDKNLYEKITKEEDDLAGVKGHRLNGGGQPENGEEDDVAAADVGHSVLFRRGLTAEARSARHHGCCISRPKVVIPNRMRTHDGRRVRAVQFHERQQIYWKDECVQVSGCTGCTCHTEERYMVALVVNDEEEDDEEEEDEPVVMDYSAVENCRLEMVVVEGCCKCLNGS